MSSMLNSKKTRNNIKYSFIYIALIIVAICASFPLVFMLSTSLKTQAEIAQTVPSIIPEKITFEHYVEVFSGTNYLPSMLNSLKIGVITALLTVVIALPASYTLARFKFSGTKALQGWMIVSQSFPYILIIIPLFIIIRMLGLSNQHMGLVLVYVVWSVPYCTWMLKGYIQNIEVEIEEAAFIDGCSKLKMIRSVLFPIIVPGVVAVAMFAFILGWKEFFFSLIVIRDQSRLTLPVVLTRYTGLEGYARWGPLAAASFVATLPSIIIFLVFQKYFISGLTGGSIK